MLSMATDRRKEAQDRIKQALGAAQQLVTLRGGSAAPRGSGGIPTGGGTSEAMFNKAVQQLIASAPGSIKITSGKRSPERQRQLWQQALKKYGDPEIADNWVARPGGSRHEHGIAADLKYADDRTKQWVHQNAKRFGLHFPLSNEDWHIELLGSR